MRTSGPVCVKLSSYQGWGRRGVLASASGQSWRPVDHGSSAAPTHRSASPGAAGRGGPRAAVHSARRGCGRRSSLS